MNTENLFIKDLQQRIAIYEDEAAYKQLFFHLFPSLQNFAFSIVRSRETAEEIVSDIFIGVWAKKESLLKIDNLKIYLFISVRNAAVKKLTREKKMGKQFAFDDLSVEFISDYANPEESLQLSELDMKIKQAVKQLPPRCQLIYKLAKEENLRYREISELLNLSVKTIDNQLAIALKKISMVLENRTYSKNKNPGSL
jgi:RNA polymerase sigma-70 factor (family 1)